MRDSILREWLLPLTTDPATRCASKIVECLDLHPPIDVDEIAKHYCDIEYLSWPFACDALAVGLGSDRPSVFIKSNQVKRRRRFTVAHELGHVRLAWHVGLTACTPASSNSNAESPAPIKWGKLLTQARIAEQETEATRFAEALLVPRRFIENQADSDIGTALESIDVAEISAYVAVFALSRNLLPGFCFLVEDTGEEFTQISSSGTQIPVVGDKKPYNYLLQEAAFDSGEVHLAGRRILWYRLSSQTEFSLPQDARTTTQILRDAITATSPHAQELFMRINGIASGMLSKQERAQRESQALSVLEHRFRSDLEFEKMMTNSDFQLYLRRKAAERSTNLREK